MSDRESLPESHPLPQLAQLSGFAWVFGAVLGGLFHWLAMRGHVVITSADDR